jgi:glyoxylase-like metal-dependent hydrolase (beta-lactamase superfamily II)
VTIPAGEVPNVVPWTAQSCWSGQMDQYAEAFAFDDTLQPGDEFVAGGYVWQALAAPGHDMDALIFFAPVAGIVVTGDALWEKGLGFVWPGSDAGTARNPHISAALATLDQIESLSPRWVVPGHGAPFTNVAAALGDARSKLKAFANDPAKNARHVAKIMFVFALLDKQSMPVSEVPRYFSVVPVYRQLAEEYLGLTHDALAEKVLGELHHVGAISVANDVVYPTMRA